VNSWRGTRSVQIAYVSDPFINSFRVPLSPFQPFHNLKVLNEVIDALKSD
jgi:hypothetical protein